MKRLIPGLAAVAVGALLALPSQTHAGSYEPVVKAYGLKYEANGLRWYYDVYQDEDEDLYAGITAVYQLDANGKTTDWTLTSLTVPEYFEATVTNGTNYATFERQFDAEGNWYGYASNKWTVVDSSETVETVIVPVSGFYAYVNAGTLTSVVFPDSLDYISGDFYDCTNLATVVVGEDTEFGRSAFDDTPWLKSQGDFFIWDGTLIAYNGNAAEVVVPAEVDEIGVAAFSGCTNLVSVVIPEGVEVIDYRAFYDCDKLASVSLPSSLREIGADAFDQCESLATIALPAGLRYIGSGAFSHCYALTSVAVPDKVKELDSTFYCCTNLTSVTLPASLESIGYETFMGCGKLASIALPEGLTDIDYKAFAYCDSLTSIALPNSLENINSYAFSNCEKLATVTGTGANLDYVSSDAFNGTALVEDAPDGVVCAGPIALRYKGTATDQLVIPEGVKYIVEGAFRYYGNGSDVTLTLPSTLKYLSGHAFADSKVKTVVGGAGITEIEHYAFGGTPFENAWYDDRGNKDVPFEFIRLGSVILGYKGVCPAHVVIPADATQLAVSILDADCDGSVTNIVSVYGGGALKRVDEYAFYGCKALESASVCGPIEDLDYGIFSGCGNLASATISGTRLYIGDIFDGCTNLVNVAIELMEPEPTGDEEEDEEIEPYLSINSDAFFSQYNQFDCSKLATVKVTRRGWKLTGWNSYIYDSYYDEMVKTDDEFDDTVATFKLYSQWMQNVWNWEKEVYELKPSYDSIDFHPVWQKVLRNIEDDGAFTSAIASTYVGWLTDGEKRLVGNITVKVTKKPRNGDAKVTVTVQLLGQKKVTLKGTVNDAGVAEGAVAGLVFGANGLYGTVTVNGAVYTVDGARDVNKTRNDPDQAVLNALKGKVWTTVFEANSHELSPYADGCTGITVTMNAKGKAKIVGTLPDATKINLTAQTIVGTDDCCIPVMFSKQKDSFGFLMWIDRQGNPLRVDSVSKWTSSVYTPFSCDMDNYGLKAFTPIAAGSVLPFYIDDDEEDLPAIEGLLTQFLPKGEPVTIGAKWGVQKAATISYKNGEFNQAAYDKGVAKGKTNIPGLKLNYTAKTGQFKGSFKYYALQGGKLKKFTANINGVVHDGCGYGFAIVKKVGSLDIFIGEGED